MLLGGMFLAGFPSMRIVSRAVRCASLNFLSSIGCDELVKNIE